MAVQQAGGEHTGFGLLSLFQYEGVQIASPDQIAAFQGEADRLGCQGRQPDGRQVPTAIVKQVFE
ncbi:hypothetical protein ABT274_30770 [Streptomyces sp. NPDC001127]|uniref:hypothetical protein n=1 Tax=Streptomyces sp. NPDC001127 TaxID=3154377 RepID=UPI0033326567